MTFNLIESRLFGRICYGFIRRKDGIVETDESKAEIIHLIYKMYLEGKSLENIQTYLYEKDTPSPSGNPKWSRDVIHKILTNSKYTRGIVSEEEFFEVQFQKEKNCRFVRN